MEVTFEEKFVFGNQHFMNCYFNVNFGSALMSDCLIADRRGVLYSPMISVSSKTYMHRLNLVDVRKKNLVITSIHLFQCTKRNYIFVACESLEGSGYCLITYCTSNIEISDAESELSSWQILDIPFKIMDMQSLTDENGNSVIILCGSDRRLHVYSLDAQCIIRRKKKSSFSMNNVVGQLLISAECPSDYLLTALPLRLFICKAGLHDTVTDTLLGYSNGIIKWYHKVQPVSQVTYDNELIQEIPSFNGNSMKAATRNKIKESNKSGLIVSRRNSAGDLTKHLEGIIGSPVFNKPISSTAVNPSHLECKIITSSSMDEFNFSSTLSESSPSSIKVDNIENKTLLFNGIVSCLCFYYIPTIINSTNTPVSEGKNKNLQWLNLKPRKSPSLPCVVVGLAGGASLLACFDDTERPVSLLPNSYKKGGVLALTLGNVSSNLCQDIFIGFHDGTVTLLQYQDSPRPNATQNDSKLSKVYFSILWEIQMAFPVLGLSFGQLLGLRKKNVTDLNKEDARNLDPSSGDTNSKILSDQLAIVTTKSFHLFSLSLSDEANAEKRSYVDRFVAELSSLVV